MSWRGLVRWGGLALLVGGLLLAISIGVGSFQNPTDPLTVPLAVLDLVGIALVLVAIPVLYARLGRAIGIWGLVGYVLFFSAGLLLGTGGGVLQLLSPTLIKISPSLMSGPPPAEIGAYFMIAGILQLIGGLLLGVTIVRARAAERYAAMLLILGSIVSFVGSIFESVPHLSDLGGVLTTLAVAWFGATLLTRRAEEVEPSMAPAEGMRARA